jgi:hypothetical protein
MTLSQAIARISYALRATDDEAPVASTDEYIFWVNTLNRKKDELFQDVGKQWSFIYKNEAPNEVGTVATTGTTTLTGTGTFFTDYKSGDQILVDGETVRTIDVITSDTVLTVTVAFSNTASAKTFTRSIIIDDTVESYHVHRSLLGLSDKVYVLDTNGVKHFLDLVHPQENNYSTQQAYLSGGNPQLLSFTQDIEAGDPLDGGTLVMPGYYMPADVSEETDLLPVPDPNWLVMSTASEIAFTDIVYEDRAEALNSRANALWKAMIATNRRATYGDTRKTPYSVKRITDTRVN